MSSGRHTPPGLLPGGSSSVRTIEPQSDITRLLLCELYINWVTSPGIPQQLEELAAEYLAAAKTRSTTPIEQQQPQQKNAVNNYGAGGNGNSVSALPPGIPAVVDHTTEPFSVAGAIINGVGRSTSPSPPGSPPVTRMPPKKTTDDRAISPSTPTTVPRMRVDEMDTRSNSPGQSSPVSPNTAVIRLQHDSSIPLAAHISEPIHQNNEHHHIPAHHLSNSTGVPGKTTSAVTASHLAFNKGQRPPVASIVDIPVFYRSREPLGEVSEPLQGEIWALKNAFAAPQRGNLRTATRDIAIDLNKVIKKEEVHEICASVFALPEWLSDLLHKRITAYNKLNENVAITYNQIKTYYDAVMARSTPNRRLFDLIRCDNKRSYLTLDDLKSAIKLLVEHHIGLDFLKQVEFQEFYCRTVAIRIMYELENKQNHRVSWPHFDRSDLPEVMRQLDGAQDINQILRFFSYEHFYVLYCRFWELDVDRDQHLDLADLQSYSGGTVTTCVLQRIVNGAGRKLTSQIRNKLDYEDFVYFCLSEEDKNTPAAVYYWFRTLDLDADGVLSGYEIGYFFEEQSRRLAEIGIGEDLRYEDMLCQMMDMIGANKIREHPQGFTLADIRSCQTPANFFNMMFNATKFGRFEHRDPFTEHQLKLQLEKTDWDRFARAEYDRMASEVQQ